LTVSKGLQQSAIQNAKGFFITENLRLVSLT